MAEQPKTKLLKLKNRLGPFIFQKIANDENTKKLLNVGFGEDSNIITGEDLFRSIYNQIQEITKDLCKA